jgi:phage terminase large subunit-like protein
VTHAERAEGYARRVVSGEQAACLWVRLACQRHLDDLAKQGTEEFPFIFDPLRPDGKTPSAHFCEFAELLPHIKGRDWVGKLIVLEDWQCFIFCVVFGWYRLDGFRRFRIVFVETPRKQSKSTMSSIVGLYMLAADGEPGAEVYSAATTRDQARIVFQDAQNMARRAPGYRKRFGVDVGAHNINILAEASKFEPLCSEAGTLEGKNVHCGIIDELHAHPTREVWDVIENATGSRRQPLIWTITTAGANRAGICYEQRKYVTEILQGVAKDETYFGIIYTIDESDPWDSPESWKKANPNYGVSVYPDDLERLARKAMRLPSAQANFLTKRLCVWVSSDHALFDMLAWARNGDPKLKVEDFVNVPCIISVDLGFVDDIAAVMRVFDCGDHAVVFGRYYVPEDVIEESRNSQYSGWHRSGRITATDGQVTDIDVICDDIAEDCRLLNCREITFDPYNKLVLLKELTKRGVAERRLVEFPQTVPMMSPATEHLMKMNLSGHIKHDGDPVLAWAMSNVIGHFDNKDNVYPKKERPENKIDPAIALIMAVGRQQSQPIAEEAGFSFVAA